MVDTVAVRRGRLLVVASAFFVCIGGRLAEAEAGTTSDGPAAGSSPVVAKLNSEGVAFYKAHDYRRAVEKFLQAYATDPDPNLLFNIARCYEALYDFNAAAEKYKLYLSDPDAEPEGKHRAEAALQALDQRRNSAPPAPSPSGERPMAESGVAAAVTSSAPAERRAFGPWPMVTLGAGAAAAAAGAVIYILGARDVSKVTGAPGFGNPTQVDPMTEGAAKQLVDSGRTKETIGAIALGVGGAALAASAALFFLRPADQASGKERAGSGLAFTPVLDAGGGRLLLGGRF